MVRSDLAEFTTALLNGAFEAPPWTTFLERLRSVTSADYAILIFKPPGWLHDEALHLQAGDVNPEASREMYRRYFHPADPVRIASVREGRPYSLRELQEIDSGAHADFFDDLIRGRGVADLREMRVEEASGVNAWLTIVTKCQEFTSQVDDLLVTLAPILRGVLRLYVAREQERHALAVSEGANQGLQIGWFTLDSTARIVSSNGFGNHLLTHSGVIGRSRHGRLTVAPTELEREVLGALTRIGSNPRSLPCAISLRRDPWLDMLLVPTNNKFVTTTGAPAAIAYVHGDNWRSVDRCGQLRDLFGLTPKEAELALKLCRGKKIAEAAAELGLKVETGRSYSKTIYDKTGARGQADLVRIIMGSILALALPS